MDKFLQLPRIQPQPQKVNLFKSAILKIIIILMLGGAVPEGRLTDLENKFAEYSENMSTLDTMFNNQVNTLQSHLTDLEKEIGEIVERINAG